MKSEEFELDSPKNLKDLIRTFSEEKEAPRIDPYLSIQIDNIVMVLNDLGQSEVIFEKNIRKLLDLINSDEVKRFKLGVEILGKILGFEAIQPKGDAVLDGVWRLRDRYLGFETNVEGICIAPLESEACRRIHGHKKWIQENVPFPDGATIDFIIISKKNMTSEDSLSHANDLFHINTSVIREIALKTTIMLRWILSVFRKNQRQKQEDQIYKIITSEKLTYRDIEEYFKT
ncbi:hypothetical protein SAMN05878482_10465 [Peribacillus simplex]|uniref:Uncharacterized protein n=1 Tax=Peribacillus simplex TaxID=1478 RepID=A0A9X8WL06_9BACI|nr:hypothetical protein [Peribacillus simplex]SIR50590.1 hypothetical protein SAMN05878482_10465 [Peribacillus simplex]